MGGKRLVIEHLVDISWKVLQDYPDVINGMIKGKAGIYALYRRNKLYYVGLANNLMGRLKTHLKDRHRGEWDRFSVYLTIHADHMKELESLILKITNPPGNKIGGKFTKSKILRPILNAKIKEKDDERRAELIGGKIADRNRKQKLKNNTGAYSLKGVFNNRTILKAAYKGISFTAVLRKDGILVYKSKHYNTPSGAARAATGINKNGWYFWKYKNNKGLWIRLNKLRK